MEQKPSTLGRIVRAAEATVVIGAVSYIAWDLYKGFKTILYGRYGHPVKLGDLVELDIDAPGLSTIIRPYDDSFIELNYNATLDYFKKEDITENIMIERGRWGTIVRAGRLVYPDGKVEEGVYEVEFIDADPETWKIRARDRATLRRNQFIRVDFWRQFSACGEGCHRPLYEQPIPRQTDGYTIVPIKASKDAVYAAWAICWFIVIVSAGVVWWFATGGTE